MRSKPFDCVREVTSTRRTAARSAQAARSRKTNRAFMGGFRGPPVSARRV
jgi:hypothetical protein